jgi:hypothetical protein
LIVGDGIREGVEAIAEYLQQHVGLHFSLGLVELPIYLMPNGERLVVPRVLARATIVTRNVIALPEGYSLDEAEDPAGTLEARADRNASGVEAQRFWSEFLDDLELDDPEQQIPRPARLGYLAFMLPAPSGSSWLTVYRNMKRGEVGVYLSSHGDTPGDYARQAIVDDWDAVRDQLGGTAKATKEGGRDVVLDCRTFGPLDQPQARVKAFTWLAERVNTFVNVLRPRVRSAAADFQSAERRTAP